MLLQTASQRRQFHTKRNQQQRIPTRRLLCFQSGGERYAIPIQRVQRILAEFPVHGVLPGGRSLVHCHGEDITVVDLSQVFVHAQPLPTPNYLIVCTLETGERLGLPVSELPTVLDATEAMFGELPEVYRQGNLPLAIANLIHVAENSEFFYLNLDQLLVTLPL